MVAIAFFLNEKPKIEAHTLGKPIVNTVSNICLNFMKFSFSKQIKN